MSSDLMEQKLGREGKGTGNLKEENKKLEDQGQLWVRPGITKNKYKKTEGGRVVEG